MRKELCETFNKEVTEYKNALLYYAKICDWEAFKINAGRLFDYVESIEMSETEKRFTKIFRAVLIILISAVVLIFRMNPGSLSEFARLRELMILTALAGCGFEVYFFLNFRFYMELRTVLYKRRRERFIANIERDFREICLPAGA